MGSGGWPNNLPEQFTTFVGRTKEREQVLLALAGTRLLALTGAGGAGKTRLALEVATRSAGSFPDGAWWVELAPAGSGDQVPGVLAGVLGVRPLPGRTETQVAIERLGENRALVVLDNCEHVRDAAADLCEAVLRECPHVVVLATTRIPLGMPWESDWHVPSLSLPPSDALRDIETSDACALFVERAAKAYPAFEGGGHNSALVARICRDLDGLPLAIELAAARVRMLSLGQIADGLSDRFRLLTTSQRGTLLRHQTLRASVDWSYALLSDSERLLLRRLAVFAGGWTLAAVESVCAGNGLAPGEILDLLTSLADESLVIVEHGSQAARYRLLETVRQYALELLLESGEAPPVRNRHLEFFVDLAERAAPELSTPRVHGWIETLAPETANIQAALNHAVVHDAERALRIGVALTRWWRVAGQLAVGGQALSRALEAAEPAPTALRARALWSCGFLARYAGDVLSAMGNTMAALEMAEAVQDPWTLAIALATMATVRMFRDPVGCQPDCQRALALARTVGDPWLLMMCLSGLGRACILSDDVEGGRRAFTEVQGLTDLVGSEVATHTGFGLGTCAMYAGDLDGARRHFARAVTTARELGDPVTEALVQHVTVAIEFLEGRVTAALDRARESEALAVARGAFMVVPNLQIDCGRAQAALGDLDDALERLDRVVATGVDGGYHYCEALLALADVLRARGAAEESLVRARQGLELAEQLGTRSLEAAAREALARLAIDRRDWTEADELLQEALALRVEIARSSSMPQTLDGLAEVAAGLESYEEASRLLGAADRGRSDLGLARWPLGADSIAALERTLEKRLGKERFADARAEGAAMPLAESVAWVRRARGTRKRPGGGWESLTPTEQQVVGLVTQGLTNPEIAKKMFISSGTAKVHLAHVFQKLGVHSRSELAALAVRRRAD